MSLLISFNDDLLQEMIDEAVKKAVSDSKGQNESEVGYDSNKKLVSREELCKILNVSNGWIYLQMRDMKLPYHRKGRRLFFDMDEIHNFLKKDINNG